MSFVTNITNFITRASTELKNHRIFMFGSSTGDLSMLNTVDKSSLAAAINEAAEAGGAATLDQLSDVTITGGAAGDILQRDVGGNYVNVQGDSVFMPRDTDLDAIAALSTTPYGRAFLALADQAALMALVRTSTEAVSGQVQLATSAEAVAGVDNTKAVHSAGLASAIAGKANTADLAPVALSGDAGDLAGTLPTSALPDLAITSVSVVADEAAMLALSAQSGDVAIRLDNSKTYILSSESPATLADWKEITAAGAVQSVAGKTGVVSLVKGDVGLGNVDNTSDANKPVSTAQQAALDAKQNSDADLTAIAGIGWAANQIPYATGPGAWAATTLSAAARGLLDDPDTATMRTTLSVYSQAEIGDINTDFVAAFEAGLA